VPAGGLRIEASCPYGLAAEGAVLTVTWSRSTTGLLRVRTAGVTHTASMDVDGSMELAVGAPEGGYLWQAAGPGFAWNMTAGGPFPALAALDTPQAPPADFAQAAERMETDTEYEETADGWRTRR
jgi:hypothetical protein